MHMAREYCNVIARMSAMKAVVAALCLIVAQVQVSTAISEDPNAEIRFTSGTIDVTEGQQLMVCVILETTLPGGITSPLTVTLSAAATGSNPASLGGDFTVTSPVEITFVAGEAPVGSPMTRCTSDIDIVDDSDLELMLEEFTVFITDPTDCLASPAFVTVNIQDNDNDPIISLDMSSYTFAEDGTTVEVCAVLSNVLPMGGSTTSDITTNFTLTNNDAVQGSDFTVPDVAELVVNFPSGSMDGASDCLPISILDDDALEGDHVFMVSLDPPAPPVSLGSPSSSPVTITDNEDVTVSLQMPVSATEGNPVTITVDLSGVPSGGLEVDVVVTLSATPGTATTADFTEPSPFTVTFTSGIFLDTMNSIMIPSIDDSIAEGNEDFMVSITSTSPTVIVGSPSSVAATIIDNDLVDVTIGMEVAMNSVGEGAGMLDVCAEIQALPAGGLQTDLVVDLTTTNGAKAVVDVDFVAPSPLEVTFSSGSSTACATFVIINDNTLELDHEFIVSLSSVTPTGPTLSVPSSSTTVTITDDEATIQMVMATDSVAEDVGVGSVAVCARINGATELECPVSAPISIMGSTKAVDGTDFSVPSMDFSFPVGTVTTACIDVTIMDDNNLEGDHTFTVELMGMTTPNLMAVSPMATTVTIQDPEDVAVNLQSISAVVEGSNTTVTAVLDTQGTLDCDLVVTLLPMDGTAVGADISAMDPLTVTFLAGGTNGVTMTATISTVNDTIAEDNETFTVSIGSTNPPTTTGTTPSQTATILASDLPDVVIQMELAMDSVAEDGGMINVCAEIATLPAGGLGTNLVVALVTSNSDGIAELNTDYTEPSPLEVTFSSGGGMGSTACATFGIVNDNNLEFDHEFIVSLSSVTPTGPMLSTVSETTTVTITDDEATNAVIQMVTAMDSVAEDVAGGSVQVCAEISGVTELEVAVGTTASIMGSIKAVDGVDFSAPSLDFSFSVGTVTTDCIDVTIIDDNNLEGDHTFTVQLMGTITPNLVAGFGSPQSTTVTIQDPEDASVGLAVISSVVEGSDFMVTVNLSTSGGGTLDCDLVVTLLPTPGTATGADYDAVSPLTVTFPVGSPSGATMTAIISAVNDTIAEDDEDFTVSIDSTNPPTTTGTTPSQTATIMASNLSAIVIQMEKAVDSVAEADGMINVCAQILALPAGGLGTNLVVALVTSNSDGIAELTTDFTEPSPLEVTFSSGDGMGSTACATFGIVNDNNLEFDHEFTVSLLSVTPAGPMLSMASGTTTVTITDDEAMNANISMQGSTQMVSEATATIMVCAVINGVSGDVEEQVTATLTLAGSTKAVLGTDFQTMDPDASFPVGALMPGCITVEISQDMSVEGDHIFSVSLDPSAITPLLAVGTPDTTMVTITDDASDTVTIGFVEDTYSGTEGGLPVPICAEITALMGTLDCELVVTFSDLPGDIAVEGVDYTSVDVFEATFTVGSMVGDTACDNITILDDNDLEGPHSFRVRISDTTPSGAQIMSAAALTLVNIQDNDGATLQFVESDYSASEGGPLEVDVCVVISDLLGELQSELVATLSDLPGALTDEGEDYSTTTINPMTSAGIYEATFPFTTTMNGNSACDTITIIDDDALEGPHDFSFIISGTSLPGVSFQGQITTVNIEDNEAATIGFTQATFPINEEEGQVDVCVQISDLQAATEVSLTVTLNGTSSGKAVEGEDFTIMPPDVFEVTFSAGTMDGTTLCDPCSIINDGNLEGNHSFNVTIPGVTPNLPLITLDPQDAVVEITDDEVETVSVGFEQISYQASENGPLDRELCAEISSLVGDLECNLVVSFGAVSNSKAVDSEDFTVVSSDVFEATFFAMLTSDGDTACDSVTIIDDEVLEGEHSFEVMITATNLQLTTINPASAFVTIEDNEDATVSLIPPTGPINEDAGNVQTCCARLTDLPTGGLGCPLVIDLVLMDGAKAVSGEDFTAADQLQITFNPGVDESCAMVSIIDDDALEGDHEFTVSIGMTAPPITINTTSIEVMIVDNEAASVALQQGSYSANEGDMLEVCAVISGIPSGGLECPVVATLSAADGEKAVEGDDYMVPDPFEVTFATMSVDGSSACINISILQDSALEGGHAFSVHLTTLSPDVVTTSSPTYDLIIIADDETASVALGQGSYAVVEGGMVEVCAVISNIPGGGLECPVVATLSAADGKAVVGDDYVVPSPFEVTFATTSVDGSSACINISIPQDSALEGDHSFSVHLTALSPDVVTVGSPTYATIIITDDENATISLTPPELTVEEGSDVDSVTVCVTISNLPAGGLQCDLMATLMPMPDTALAGEDYNAAPLQVVIPASMMDDDITVCVNKSVMVIDDHIVEFPENFTIELTGSTPPVEIGAMNSATVTIVDDDKVTIGLEICQYTVIEGGSQNICGTLDGYLQRPVTVYLSINSSILLLEFGSMASPFNSIVDEPACVEYNATDDDIKEDTEQLTLRLTSHDDSACLCRDFGTLSVFEDSTDGVELSFVETDYTVDEDAGVQRVCVELTGELETSISVTVDTQPNTALVGEDFVQFWQTLVFDGSTNTTQCVYIPIINDDCVEDELEVFTATLRSDDDCVSFGNSSTTIHIIDNDCVTIAFKQSDITVNEDEGVVHICPVIKCGCLRRAVEVNVFTQDGTATAGSDYSSISTTLTFTPTGSPCVYITILEDTTLEDPENFSVHLESSDANVKLEHNYSTITIRDNDAAEVEFTMANYMVSEADGSLLVCVSLTGNVERPVVVTVTTLDGSAVATMDYYATSEVIEFTAAGEQCVNISINMDGVLEEEGEQFSVVLTTRDDAITIGRQFATVTIMDSDVVNIGFAQMMYTVSEEDLSGEGNTVLVCVILTGVLDDDVEVVLTTMSGSATGGVDFVDIIQQSMSLEFTFDSRKKRSIGPTEQCTTISIISDDLVEDDETFHLQLNTTEEGVELNPANAYVTITNNDDANITLQQSDHTVGEADGSLTVCAELTTGNLERDITVYLNTVDGTATGNQDFSQLMEHFTFSAGSPAGSTACADISIINDDILESDEVFTVTLTSSDPVNFDVSMTSCTITEDTDSIAISLVQTGFTVTEGSDSVLPVTVVITGASLEREVSIRLFTADITAIAGGDYDSVDTSVTFVSGETFGATRTININITDDQSVEDDESFGVSITTDTPPDPVVFGISTAQVTIIEDSSDMVTIGFEQTDETVAESAGSVTIRANILSGVLEREVCVNISPVAGSATGDGVDFMAESVKLTFSPTINEVSKVIIIINDTLLEDDETFSHLIESDDPAVILDPATATVTIMDDDEVCFEFDPPSYTVCEGDPNLMPRLVCVRLESGELGRDVIVTVQTEDDSALSTGDYIPITQDLTFLSGGINALQCAVVTITDDGVTEPCERFFVTMNTDVPRVKVGNDAAVIVNDDDPLEVCFTGDTPMVTGDTVDIQFLLQGCASVTCSLTRGNSPLVPPPQDCSPPIGSSTGMTMFNLPALNLEFMLTLSVEPLCGQPAFDVTRGFRRDNPQCSLHLINKGLTIIGNTATIEWEATGPSETTVIDVFECRLDDAPVFTPCSTPFIISGLDAGDHMVTFRPDRDVANQLDCSRSAGRTLEFTI